MNWIKIVLLFGFIYSLSLSSCKSSKPSIEEELTPVKNINESEVDKFKSKVKRLQSSIKTGDYNSSNSIVKQINYDINREIEQTKDFMSRARLTPEGKAKWDSKLLLQSKIQRRVSMLHFGSSDSPIKIINVVKTLDAFIETMN